MGRIKKILIFVPIFLILAMPAFSMAQTSVPLDRDNGGLVPCGNDVWPQYTYKEIDPTTKKEIIDPETGRAKIYNVPKDVSEKKSKDDIDVSGQAVHPCGFGHLMVLVNKVINFILFALALPIAAIMFAYAGFLLLFSGGESGKKTKAKEIFTSVAIGVIIAVIAWLAVELILNLLGYDGAWIGF